MNISRKSETVECLNTSSISKVLLIIGIFTNCICIIVFSIIIKRQSAQGNMFKYLLIKSIMDFSVCLTKTLNFSKICVTNRPSLFCILMYILIYEYVQMCFQLLSIVFEIAATFDCYININRKLNCCQTKLYFYLFSIFLFISSSSVYLIFPLQYKIEKMDTNQSSYYFLELSKFGISLTYFQYHYFVNLLIRDCTLFSLLVLLNLMILYSLYKTTARRRNLAGNNSNNALLISSINAERRKMMMIVATGLNFMIGHFPNFVWNFCYDFFDINFECAFNYIKLLFDLSYVDSIIFYFIFNNVFKKILIGFIPFINRNNR
jgi:hypothetical protein